jgi:hypothetical protein
MEILEILKYTLPAFIVFLTAWLLIRAFINRDVQARRSEIVMQNQRIITPIRLQAYERITLFLERIAPENMLMRVTQPGMLSKQLQTELLASIRAEFEHNLSQQIYMTPQAWEVIKNAKNNTIKLINLVADKVKSDAPALELSKAILEMVMELESSPSTAALEFLKKEINQVM